MEVHMEDSAGKSSLAKVPLLLPHEMFAAIFKAGPARWQRTLGEDTAIQQFWAHMVDHSRWASSHPHRDSFQYCVPVGFYGDSAKVTKEDSLLTLTWNSIVTSHLRPSVESRLVICAIPTTWLVNLDEVTAAVVWSMGAMMDGFYPNTDHLGRPFPPRSTRQACAGLPLAGGYTGCLCEFRGDWEWMAKALGTPSAGSGQPCWFCLAAHEGPLTWTDFRPEAPWRQTSRQHLRRQTPLTKLGFHLDMVRPDIMHTVCLGVSMWTNAALLLLLADKGRFGAGSVDTRLRTAWKRFKEWVHSNNLGHCSQRPFTQRRVQATGEKQDYAELLAKGWNSRLISTWLAFEMQTLDLVSEMDHLHATMAWAVSESYNLCERNPRYLDQGTAHKYRELVTVALDTYRSLAVRFVDAGVLRLPLRPKLHLWAELSELVARDCCNPRFFHCFADEDFLRTVLRAARACSRASMPAAVVKRFSLRMALIWSGRARASRPRQVGPPITKRPFKLRHWL